jgi:hypothetical protein
MSQSAKRSLAQAPVKTPIRFVIAPQLLQKISAPSQKSLANLDIFFRAKNEKFIFTNR